jgi:arylsulfatase A-like enzyme
MKSSINRRDFLKLASGLMLTPLVPTLPNLDFGQSHPGVNASGITGGDLTPPNVIIILFDALSALQMSTYGYLRDTSPNLARFAERALVYHNHHSAGNFTTPSTASFLTGVYPWTHRAFTYGNRINEKLVPENLFSLLNAEYYQVAYTQNLFADTLLRQFSSSLDRYIPLSSFSLAGGTIHDKVTQKDSYYAMGSLDDFLFDQEEISGSLFLSSVNDLISTITLRIAENKYDDQYPLGFPKQPKTKLAFTIDQVIDGVINSMAHWVSPFLAYIHFIPPHAPYRPHRDYQDLFDDGWEPEEKPVHPLSKDIPQATLNYQRREYDQYIANLDVEVGRLFNHLEESGLIENSYVIFTSDHGELFERGTIGHSTRLVFEPVLRVPLFISVPGQRARQDIHTLTNTVDILPTLLHIAGLPAPEWCDGTILPGIGDGDSPDRPVYTVEAKSNSTFEPLKKASIALIQDQYKLIRYLGYSDAPEWYEFYDLQNDPEELINLYKTHVAAKELQATLDQKIKQVNQPFI